MAVSPPRPKGPAGSPSRAGGGPGDRGLAAPADVGLRPIRSDDAAGLVAFHARLSPRSVYRRFFFVHPVLSATEVERFTCVDRVDRVALVAEDGDRLVAVGRYDREADEVRLLPVDHPCHREQS